MSDPDGPLPPLFPGRDGTGVRVAVIDSGVHPEHDHINAARIVPGVRIDREGLCHAGPAETLDRLGHGTAVTAAILEKAPGATCIPVRVFADSLATNARALLAAIRWATAQDVDVINLSLGTTNTAHTMVFAEAVAEAAARGIAVIAAHDVDGTACLPGSLPCVLGVTLDWDCQRERYYAPDAIPAALCASGFPRAIPGVAPRRNLYGISFAVAQITGFAACALEGRERHEQSAPAQALHAALVAALKTVPALS